MRAGGCSVQQALTVEAASVIKQAVTLARRRGHAQVTPLHVASTMLASSTGLLRTACLQSHSHPLQCKALELCFNVALNRLPSSSASPMLGSHHSQHPSISNALIAAFKRAQAHQRRGSIENQQQPLLAVKIESEQLIISILDDPSVSRVMREAGFSSTQVKSNVEQAVSLEICSQTPVSSNKSKESHPPLGQIGIKGDKPWVSDPNRSEDVMYVVENLVKKRRSTVIMGECLASVEGVVRAVMDKVEKGDVPEDLRDVKFVNISLLSFAHLSRDGVEKKLGEIKNMVIKSYMGSGVVLYLGDLKWASENRASSGEQGRGLYCPLEHMIMELGKLVCGIGESSKFWLMGIATFQTYMRCKSGHPSLETVWCLHPLTIPADNLSLSLITDSDQQSHYTSKKMESGSSWLRPEGGEKNHELTCCADCSAKFEREAQSLQSSICNSDSTTSSLPAWLQQYKNETKGLNSNDQDCVPVKNLCKKWNSICSSIHKQPNSSERTLTFSSILPSKSTSSFSYDHQNPNFHQTHHDWLKAEPKPKSSEPNLRIYIPDTYSTPNSTTSSDIMEMECANNFKELSAENLKTLCIALEKKVPWQKDIIPDIATTILECRSGSVRRKGKVRNSSNDVKEETWFFFQGLDNDAKEKIARELARLIFGSQSNFVSIALSTFSSTRADSIEDCRNKRSRDEQSCSYIERFAEKVSSNPHRVFLVEDVEQADYCSQMGFKRAIESGRIMDSNGEEVSIGDAIVILSCESFSSRSRACSPPKKRKSNNGCEEERSNSISLDLNIPIDDDSGEDKSIDDIGLLESVDRQIMFKIQEL